MVDISMDVATMNRDASVSGAHKLLAAVIIGIAGIAKSSKGARAFTYGPRNSFGSRNELIPHLLMILLYPR